VRGVVQKIINDIFIDGQLDECDLALRDLHLIAKSFTRSLSGIYHHRIDYPEKPGANDEKKDKQRKKAKDPDADQDPESKTHEEPPQEPGGPGIKRLGQM
jgi:cyclic-di-AMP phosphodiesterase PgpH